VTNRGRIEPFSGELPGGALSAVVFHATVHLDPMRLSASGGRIGDEIVQQLQGLTGADVKITSTLTPK
jgi:hypothetical protein